MDSVKKDPLGTRRKYLMILMNQNKYAIVPENSEGRKRKAFLDFLIEFSEQDPDLMNDLDIREEVDTFMFEVSCLKFDCYSCNSKANFTTNRYLGTSLHTSTYLIDRYLNS
jgi:hypothetical protein